MIIYSCPHCGWQSEPIDGVAVNRCGNCRKWGLSYTKYSTYSDRSGNIRQLGDGGPDDPERQTPHDPTCGD
jgi:hypothetical protein